MKVWPGCERYRDVTEGRITHHSFSFGHHYDPGNLAFGPMRAFDDHLLDPGAGFDEHRHSDVELVTWVQEGVLVHTGEDGSTASLPAGSAHVQSAGAGIRHTERAAAEHSTRFVQSWLVPDSPGTAPTRVSSAPASVSTSEHGGPAGWHPVAGAGSPLPVDSVGATLWFGRVRNGEQLALPEADAVHLFVLDGSVELIGPTPTSTVVRLATGDAVRGARQALEESGAGAYTLRHLAASEATTAPAAELLVWTFAALDRPS